MLVCFAARMSKEESRSVLLEKYVTAKVILNNNLKFFLSATFKYNISGIMIKEKKTRFFLYL